MNAEDIEKAIRETLVIENGQSVHLAVNKILALTKKDGCKHNKGTLYSPETGTVCIACKQKLVQIQVTEKEAKMYK